MPSLAEPADLASRICFRILFGVLAAAESYRLVHAGFAEHLWVEPTIFFPWPGLGWLAPWPGDGIYIQLYLQVLLGLAVAVGFQHRVAGVLLGLGFSYLLAICETAYLVELHLLALLSFVVAATPADRSLSVDVLLRPERETSAAPLWSLWLLRAQVGLVIVCAGIAMLDGDWLRGYPLRLWLPTRQGMPLLGALHASSGVAVGISWMLAALHLGVVPALLLRPTRHIAFAAWVVAQLWVHQTFDIGVLPWLLILGATLFFPADWPRRIFNWPARGAIAAPARRNPAAIVGAALWIAAQVLLPIGAWLLPGPTAWTERGRTSSWRYLHDSKGAALQFVLEDVGTGRRWTVAPDDLSAHQRRRVASDPVLLARYGRMLAEREAAAVRVRALGLVTLNGRQPQRLVDPERDLAEPRDFGDAWILPLETALEDQWIGQRQWPAPRDEVDLE